MSGENERVVYPIRVHTQNQAPGQAFSTHYSSFSPSSFIF